MDKMTNKRTSMNTQRPQSTTPSRFAPFRAQQADRATAQTTPVADDRSKKPAAKRLSPSVSLERRVLHVGCGTKSETKLHAVFKQPSWREIRFDIDENAAPDFAGSIVDMRPWIDDGSCDAIWASHVLEHLSRHEVPIALREFRRVLAPTGFALIRLPDLEKIAEFIVAGRANEPVYHSPAGPITPIDMLYGHGASIERGQHAMRHGTGFSRDLLASDLIEAGFAEVRCTRTDTYEVWAVAFMPEAAVTRVLDTLASTGLELRA